MRQPVVSDRFYPGHPATLTETVAGLLVSGEEVEPRPALAVIVPHAGYVYSGGVAGETFSRVQVPKTALILGPNHTGRGRPLALGLEDWAMPMGRVPIDRELAVQILKHSEVIIEDEDAHLMEHSLEVEVPFLQYLQEELAIVPIVAGHVPYEICRQAGHDLAQAIAAYGEPVLMVASTDMTHYEPRASASVKDQKAIEQILALDSRRLYATVAEHRISMCGVIPTTIVLRAAVAMGASEVELVRYTDSGAVSGDIDQVVGYAGLIIR